MAFEESAFAGDSLLEAEIVQLVKQYDIQSAVETGTYLGFTARRLADLVPMVYTIELMDEPFGKSQEILASVPNVNQYHGASQNVLPDLLPRIKHSTLYYLDAHWYGYFPLLEEIEIIACHDPKPIIVFHDMQVPGHPELHYDLRPVDAPYSYEWVRPQLEKIRAPWKYYYNSEAEGAKVGVMFVVPV